MKASNTPFMPEYNNEPLKPSEAELKEIFAVVRQYWGAETDAEFPGWAESVYAVKFNFHSGSPGYVGDLFMFRVTLLQISAVDIG